MWCMSVTLCRPIAHRCGWLSCAGAEARGIEVIIAGAGGAAHLPGMVAAQTTVPVLGVRFKAPLYKGSIHCSQSCRCLAACPSGPSLSARPAQTNAGLLAVSILSNSRSELRKLGAFATSRRRESVRNVCRGRPVTGSSGGRVSRCAWCRLGFSAAALGRMFAIAARRMGYRASIHLADSPAGQIADVEITAMAEDLDALRAFARGVDVVTFEFENVPIDAIDA